MNTIITKQGDTFESISRRAFGTENKAQAIRRANPSVFDPIPSGLAVTVPRLPNAPRDKTGVIAGDNISLVLDGASFTAWTDVALTLSMDSSPTLSVSSPWNPQEEELKRVFKPFSFLPISVSIGTDPLFEGVMLTPHPASTADGSVISASAYGLTGVAYDCTAPASSYPLEFDNLTLDAIASQLLRPFGIGMTFSAPAGAPFERVSMQPDEPVMPFLAKLSKQRNLVIGETETGEALFHQSAEPGNPVAILEEYRPPVDNVAASFTAQGVYSDITAISPTVPGAAGDQNTVKNARLPGVVRPYTFTATDTPPDGLKTAAEAKIGRMYANAVSWVISVPSWRGPNGDIWKPNTTVKLKAPNAMIFNRTEFIIKEVRLAANEDGRTAALTIVLPGAFSGKIPEELPWD